MVDYVINPLSVDSYSPANHSGTRNKRIISQATVNAVCMEALIGTIQKGEGAFPHAHPWIEQVSMVLVGCGGAEVKGKPIRIEPRQCIFNPKGDFHIFETLSDIPVQVLVIYAPPYAENPDATVLYHDDVDSKSKIGEETRFLSPSIQDSFIPEYHDDGTYAYPIVNKKLANSEHIELYEQHSSVGSGASDANSGLFEQFMIMESGSLSGMINNKSFSAKTGDWVFIPKNAEYSYRVNGQTNLQCLVGKAKTH